MPEIIVKLGDNIVHKYVFDKEIMSVGRARDNDVVIENLSVSRNHARIRKEGERFILTDLNSANGTYVNGVRVTRVEIVHDDVISIGKHKLHFLDQEQSDEEIIGEAFGAERTMLVDRAQGGLLVVTKGKQKDQEFQIAKYETYVGRASDNDVRLHDWFVSKKHAVIIRQGSNFFIKDLGSWRGTMVNGKNVRDCELKDTDEIQLGTTVLAFKLEGEALIPQITGRVPQEIGYEESEEVSDVADTGAPGSVKSPEEFQRDFERVFDEEAVVEEIGGDEFSPLSEDELLEMEEEEKELEEAEPGMAGVSAGHEFETPPSAEALGDQEMEAEEVRFAESVAGGDEEMALGAPGFETSDAEQQEEEMALLGESDVPGEEPGADSAAAAAARSYHPLPDYQELPAQEPGSPDAASPEALDDEVAMWLNALQNKSRVIRREAARKLKQLTGRDYDWESAPE